MRSPTSSGFLLSRDLRAGTGIGCGIAAGGSGMSLMLLARSCCPGGDLGTRLPGEVLMEGRCTALSARDLNCSDQFRPSPERASERSDRVLGFVCVLACDGVFEDLVDGFVLGVSWCWGVSSQMEGREGAALPFDPTLVPLRPLKSACAPKDMRRAKGVVGTLRAVMSRSSSMADSSMESEPAVEMLARRLRGKKGAEVWMGEVPERPSVLMDMRLR